MANDGIMGENDFRVDSARFISPITTLDQDLPNGLARGIWLNEESPVKIDYEEEDGTERIGLLLLPGPNMFIVKRVLSSSEGAAADLRAIY